MIQSKYNSKEYWKRKVIQSKSGWRGLFNNEALTHQSVIINPVIINIYSQQMEMAWSVFPDPYSVLGFLKQVYLPKAFTGYLLNEMYQTDAINEGFLDILKKYKKNFPEKIHIIQEMESFYCDLNDFWYEDDEICLNNLKDWSWDFNQCWKTRNGILISFRIFASPIEAVEQIVKTYEKYLGIKTLEADLQMSKNELIQMAGKDIFINDLMKWKFKKILTNRMKMIF